MFNNHCPGAKDFREPKPEEIRCQFCGENVEIWSDEIKTLCTNCGKTVFKAEGDKSCINWCNYAKECIGAKTYNEFMETKSCTLKEKLIKELETYFGSDLKRINHAKKVLEYAEIILRAEGGDWNIVIPASVLHDVGIKAAEEKYGSNAGKYQEMEGPKIAEKIMLEVGLKKNDIKEVCEIIAHHHTLNAIDTTNFRILTDADWLVNIKDEFDLKDKDKLKDLIDKVMLTKKGKELAEEIYL